MAFSIMTLSIPVMCVAISYAECRDYLNVMLSVVMLNVVKLSVVAPI
jgi:hypothetical protein